MDRTGPVGVAFVGCGNVSGPYGDQIAAHRDRIRLVGAFDILPQRTEAFAAKHGCKAYRSMQELLDDDQVEVGLNITTHTAHAEVTTALLQAGKHVHSEKPVASTREDAQRMIDLARRRGRLFGCSPAVILGEAQRTFRRMLLDGAVGEILEVYAEMNHGRIERWHGDPEAFYGYGAGPLLDVGCYPLSILIQIFGSAVEVRAMGGVRMGRRTIKTGPRAGQEFAVTNPDHMVCLVQFACGVRLRLTTSFLVVKSAQVSGIEAHGTDGSLWLESSVYFNSRLFQCRPAEYDWTQQPADAPPYNGIEYVRGLVNLASALRDGHAPALPAQAAWHVLDICLSAMESARSGLPVALASRFEPTV